ncbi:hypothetical protein AAFF_G00333660 [Aldrovandia affinis]|uniref:Ig-like domain-containing protein n=1 Tax=Aldrovandia affinis TaxID=143900 RepID=A0AAD7W042_9TELE|nr:hypothetical protein AAFF_G00333660 [Aldrovandia affinis]
MDSFIFLLLLGVFTRVHSETHELQYIYTALSKPIEMPGVYKFTAMGILDGRPIDKYNSQEKVKEPVQEWMRNNPKDYWEKGTQSRKSKEQWFDVNVNILMDRMRQNHSDVHILQWTHGCKAEVQPGGGLKYVEGFDQYGYDGEDFLSFNAADRQWVAPVTEAVATKKKWDDVDILNLYTQGYLEKECVQSLERFLKFQEEFFGRMDDSPPKVHVWAKESFQPGKLILVCLATEFFPKDVKVDIFRGKLRLDESDGVTSSGVRPNGMVVAGKGETFQLRKTLEIEKSDTSEYSCVVNHRTLSVPLETKWDGKVTSDVATPIDLNIGVNIGGIIGGIIGAIITLLAVGACCVTASGTGYEVSCPLRSQQALLRWWY